MKFQIFGESWRISIQDDKKFDELYGDKTEATTKLDKKLVILRPNCSKETVRHEVCHIVYSYMITLNLKLNLKQQEEFLCEFIEKYGLLIEKITSKIYNKL